MWCAQASASQATPRTDVNNNLQAIETPQGHGDSFWSVCLGLDLLQEGTDVRIEFI
jgi:hypothetical protein